MTNVIQIDKPTASVVTVTPDVAARWIAKNKRNRNIRKRVVNAYARDMETGSWQITGEAIKFDQSGNLIDGQHRLTAVIQSGATVLMFVVRGLSTEAQDVMDSGSKRQAADALQLGGWKNPSTIAAAVRLELSLTGDATAFTNSEISEWVNAHPEIASAAANAIALRNLVDLTPAAITVAWYRLNKVDADDCAAFWDSIANNTTTGAGDPRNTLIRRVASARRQGERLDPQVQIVFVIRAWNAWRRGDDLSILRDRASNGKGGSTRVSLPKAV